MERRRREGGAVAIATWRGRGRQEIESESASEERKWTGNVVKFRKLVGVEVESREEVCQIRRS